MVELSRLIERFGPTDLTVLIEGESGTGKELVANALHQSSPRSRRIFAAVNCGELTETIVQSELFGHERGSFTGADRQHAGWFERASGGTLFLDEIGELPMTVQPRLLRVLQERKIHRLGGTQSIDVDVRIIAATNVNLESAIAQDRFRSDLYYRINELSLTTPPLRDRREDIPLLAECFMRRFKEETGLSVDGVSPEASRILQQYSWPGNVRELENAIKRIVVTARDRVVQPADLPPKLLSVPAACPIRPYSKAHQRFDGYYPS